jgi:GxxExxY protein
MNINEIPTNDITHIVIGILFEVYNEIGYGYQEKHYYRAIKNKLIEKGFAVEDQLYCKLLASGKQIGSFYLDFLIANRVVLELKVANGLYSAHVKQVINYLKEKNLRIGIIGVFTKSGVIIKRIAN